MTSLDDRERARSLASPLYGDRWVQEHATLPVREATVVRPRGLDAAAPGGAARPGGASPASGAVVTGIPAAERDVVSLDGEWLLAGAPVGREFAIERWFAGPRPADPVSWHRPDTDRSGWMPAAVPGTVQAALTAAGEIPDPLLHDHTYAELVEHGVPREWPWQFRRTRVEEQQWWYARRFDVPGAWRGQRVRLAFDGVDETASFWVNGEPIARHSGMYGGPEIDVTSLLRGDGTDEVVVRIDPPPRDWHGVLKPSPGWGWHYGHLISMGIWRSVRLERVPDLELDDLFVSTVAATEGHARLRVQWDLIAHTEGGAVRTRVRVLDPDGTVVADVTAEAVASPGTSRHAVEVDVPDARLWWPFGYGDQPLYRVEASVEDSARAVAVGIRTVDMRPLPEVSGDDVYDWRFVVNGRALFLKGANWCFTDPMARRGFGIDRHLLDLCVRANLQMLRAWGGGTVESDAFYDECDRRGILVLQEFPLSFGLDATGRTLATVDEQASRIVRRLRSHPSLVMWGGGNENPETVSGDDLLTVIGTRVRQYDPTRPFHRTDPWGGSEHYYGVYHEGEPVEAYATHVPPVFGEYGLSSPCDLDSMARFLDPALLEEWPPPAHGAIVQHQAQFSLFDLFKQARYAHYGPLTDWATFVEYAQLAQGDALRFASERLRAHAGERTAAYWFYKVGEVFPGASWAIVDYYGRAKLSYYRARQFGAPRSAFAVYDRTSFEAGEVFSAEVHVANDTPAALAATVTARIYDARFGVIAERTASVDLDADAHALAFTLEAEVPDAGPLVLAVYLRDADGRRISSAWYALNAQPRSAEVEALEAEPLESLTERPIEELLAPYRTGPAPLKEQPRTRLEARFGDGGLHVRNVGEVPAPIVLVDGFPTAPGAWLDDNAFGLEAGEERLIAFSLAGASWREPRVRAWNADAVAVTS
ncbi:beta-mannosidase [Microbacterium trichothecenolyticum]|uniref:Beta-mannosidase B n=1 Tax=Microbacterium trichothecenolyticum TaxID=69370 RepID=A0ABU0TX45_MICTR|nr:sugar-binding domain-containing protein [Microbacterium trichothecenolyticum]MDQ1123529.1 beta-mannosidase [Microbacterium trichothecenolyticum]